MPYCSIEEAWGSSFDNKKKKQETNYRNIVPDNASNNMTEYSDIEFDNDNVYTKSGNPVLGNKKEKKRPRRKSFSRTMSRLPDTSGPNNRYIEGDNYNELEFSDNSNTTNMPTKILKKQKKVTYKNTDTPISAFNKDLEQNLYDSQELSNINLDNTQSENSELSSSDDDGEYYLDNEEAIVPKRISSNIKGYPRKSRTALANNKKYLISEEANNQEESIKYKNYKDFDMLELQQTRNTKMKNNMLDIIVYIITGIFLIFILDLFVRLGKNAQ